MPDLIAHIDQAAHNQRCANFILSENTGYRDWAITAAFYAAVHYVEACFAVRGDIGHSESAKDRTEEPHSYRIRKINELAKPAHASYRKLYRASRAVRYLTMSSSQVATDFYNVDAARRLIEEDLLRVQQELEKAFGVRLS